MDSASTSRPFVTARDDQYLEYSAANRRAIELLGKLLEAAKRAQAQGKQIALNRIILEANRLSNRLSISMEKSIDDNAEQDLTAKSSINERTRDSQQAGPRRMFFTEALYLRNKQAMAQEARMYVPVRGEIVE